MKENLEKIVAYLLSEHKDLSKIIPNTVFEKYTLFEKYQALANIRPAKALAQDKEKEFFALQDAFLQEYIKEKGIFNCAKQKKYTFEEIKKLNSEEKKEKLIEFADNIYLWQGDITKLKVDAIVNAANSKLLGCFYPLHKCIDNIIHTHAGLQLRLECQELMQKQGHDEKTGKAKITQAYNLPCKNVIHTVGPIIYNNLSENDCLLLASCYRSCLEIAEENKLNSLAFCCISTGEFRFPQDKAAQIALAEVQAFQKRTQAKIEIIFDVFKEEDYDIYLNLLSK